MIERKARVTYLKSNLWLGHALVVLLIVLVSTGCGEESQLSVDNANTSCANNPDTPYECEFTIMNSVDAKQPMTYLVSTTDPQRVEITPATSQPLWPGVSVRVKVVIHRCPQMIRVQNISQQGKPVIYTSNQPVCDTR